MNNELLINNLKSNNSEFKSNNEEKQIIEEMAKVLKDYTERNHIMASHVILECYAEELYSKNYRKQSEGEWYIEDLTGIIKCKLCDNDAPISTVSGEQYKASFCQHCGAKMKNTEN